MTDIQAAVGLVQLGKLDAMVRGVASSPPATRRLLADVPGLRTVRDPAVGQVELPVVLDRARRGYPLAATSCSPRSPRDGVSARAGIMAAHRQPAYAGHPHADLPVTERLTDHTLILPLYHTMGEDEQAAVVGAIRAGRRSGVGVSPPLCHPSPSQSRRRQLVTRDPARRPVGPARAQIADEVERGLRRGPRRRRLHRRQGCGGVRAGVRRLRRRRRTASASATAPTRSSWRCGRSRRARRRGHRPRQHVHRDRRGGRPRGRARPVLVDVDDDALLIDPSAVADAVTARTRAVIPVDLYGQVAPFEQLADVARPSAASS